MTPDNQTMPNLLMFVFFFSFLFPSHLPRPNTTSFPSSNPPGTSLHLLLYLCVSILRLLSLLYLQGFSCTDLMNAGMRQSGVYYLQIRGTTYWFLKVFCEQEIADGGWTVINRLPISHFT